MVCYGYLGGERQAGQKAGSQKREDRMKTICLCYTCHREVKQTRKFLKIVSVAIELGIVVKRVICSDCE